MKYHALFVVFEKAAKFANCRLLQIIGGALRVNASHACIHMANFSIFTRKKSEFNVHVV